MTEKLLVLHRLQEWRAASSAFWLERNARERKLLICAASALTLGLLYALFIDPALQGRTQLEKNLPLLRQQAAELQALSKEVSGLTVKAAASVAPMTRESIDAGLARKGLKAQSVTLSADFAKVQLAAVPFASVLRWLDEAQKVERLMVVDANVSALESPGSVNAVLTLRQQKAQ